MYIIGHCAVTEQSGVFRKGEAVGPRVVALMLPDFVRCHRWGYETCFGPPPASLEGKLIRSHILGDWFVHYGPGTRQSKRGWAYQRMRLFARRYQQFFAAAHAAGLRETAVTADSVAGFAHTMVEYSIDVALSKAGVLHESFGDLKEYLGSLGTGETGLGSMSWILDAVTREGIALETQATLAADIESYRTRVRKSTCPTEFAYRACAKKFGLDDSGSAIDFVASVLDEGLKGFAAGDIEDAVSAAARFVAEHLSAPVAHHATFPWH